MTMQNEMRDRLEEMVIDAEIKWQNSTRSFSSVCADYLIENGVIVPPCKLGSEIYMLVTRHTKSFEWENKKMILQNNQHTFIKKTTFTKSNFFKVIEQFGKTEVERRQTRMREILFKGKTPNGEWVQGDLSQHKTGKKFIRCKNKDALCSYEVIPKTVGQYTGLTDKNGTKIFEGDIVKAQDDIFGSPFCNGITGKIVYEETAYFIEPQDVMNAQWLFNECAEYEVIGNIHDNPELLRGE